MSGIIAYDIASANWTGKSWMPLALAKASQLLEFLATSLTIP